MARMKILRHRAEHFADAGCLCGGEPHRPNHLLRGQLKQFADCGRGAEHTCRCGDVPAGFVVRRVDGVSDPRLGFETQQKRMQEVRSGNPIRACVREERCGNGRRRVDVIHRRRVVEFELEILRDDRRRECVPDVAALIVRIGERHRTEPEVRAFPCEPFVGVRPINGQANRDKRRLTDKRRERGVGVP